MGEGEQLLLINNTTVFVNITKTRTVMGADIQ